MSESSEKYSCKLSVAHYRRAQARFLKILDLIEENAIGDVILVDLQFHQSYQPGTEATWRTNPAISGGGLFHDLAPHQLDLMIFLFGYPVTIEGTSLNRANFYEADDYVSTKILFPNNIRFKGVWDFNARKEDEIDLCEIRGTNGAIRFAVFGNLCETNINEKSEQLEFQHLPHVQQPMIEQVVNYFLGKGSNPCSARDGVEVMIMIDEITGKK